MSEELNLTSPRRMGKKPLGRGLGSLLREASTEDREQTVSSDAQVASQTITAKPQLQQPAPVTTTSTATTAQPPKVNTESAKPAAAPVQNTAPVIVASAATVKIDDKDRIWHIAIEKLKANKEQPRKVFEQSKLQELVTSIKEKGVMLPIVARKLGENNFEIIAGERRWRAAQQAGLKEVPVILRTAENRDALELALIENIQRQDLLPIEEAEAYGTLATRYGLTQAEIAQKVGKDRSTVANVMRLMGLTTEVKSLMKQGELQLGQAKVLLSIDNPVTQTIAAKKVIAQQLSVRATERLVAKLKNSGEEDSEQIDGVEEYNKRDIQPLISELQKILGTKVTIDVNGNTSRVSAYFYSVQELNQFVDKLRKIQK